MATKSHKTGYYGNVHQFRILILNINLNNYEVQRSRGQVILDADVDSFFFYIDSPGRSAPCKRGKRRLAVIDP